MRNFLSAAALAAGAQALSMQTDKCCVHLSAHGGPGGYVGQLGDGQVRVGQDQPATTFCLNSGGVMYDESYRPCYFTKETSQLQCDTGSAPASGISVSCDGKLTTGGVTVFKGCPTQMNGGYNVYKSPPAGQDGCVDITFTSDGCKSNCSSPPTYPSSASHPPPEYPSSASHPPPEYPSSASHPPPEHPSSASHPPPEYPSSASHPPPEYPSSASHPPPEHPSSASHPPPTYPSSAPSPPPEHPSSASHPPPEYPSSASHPPPTYPSSTPSPPPEHPSSAPSPSSPPSSSPPSSYPTAPVHPCGPGLAKNFEFPHLIIPVDSKSPSEAKYTSYFGTVSATTKTLFSFDIPSSVAGKTCSLVFLLPKHEELTTSNYTLTPPGSIGIQFGYLAHPPTQGTTWESSPSVEADLGSIVAVEGGQYTVESAPCPAGKTVGVEAKATSGGYLEWFQDYNPAAIGLYVNVC